MTTQNTNEDFNPHLFQISVGQHHGSKVIWLQFDYNLHVLNHLRQFVKARWSAKQKCWYIADNLHHRKLCLLEPVVVGKEVLDKIAAVNLPELQRLQDMMVLKGFSPNTIRCYTIEFAQLLYLLKDFPVTQLTAERLQSYFLYCAKELQLSENQIHSRMSAIKFYFERVLHQDKMFFDIPRPKKPSQLPKALNAHEVKQLLNACDNIKHKLVLQLCYGMGLRVSEIVNLKIEDIDSGNMRVLIKRGKGKKDRYTNLPESVLEDLRNYYRAFRPKEYLFEGQYGGQYSIRSVQLVFKNAMQKAGIRKTIGIHGLRHSYATHLLELGTDLSFIQKLLGHNDIKTTQIYAKVSDPQVQKVKSPLDNL
jgi:site-specific recombinase XerD